MKAAFTFGKFNQLHNGHVALFHQALETHDHLYIGLSSHEKNGDLSQRLKNIDRIIAHNGWRGRVCILTSSNMWEAFNMVHEPCDVVLGEDRERTGIRLAAERSTSFIKVKRLTSSTEVRRRIAAGEDISDLVPSYLINN